MILTKPSHQVVSYMYDYGIGPLELIESAGRTCYKSEDKVTSSSAKKFVKMILKRGHESVIEHSAMTVRFICDRGVSHELVRHRLCAFSQESTRYCNYKGGCEFIIPPWIDIEPGEYSSPNIWKEFYREGSPKLEASDRWMMNIAGDEIDYKALLELGWSPQQARSILPNSLKTEIVVTANLREWRHIFRLRCSKAAHPQMRELMIPLFKEVKLMIPIIFDDLEVVDV